MNGIVLDCSVSLSWCLDDQADAHTDGILEMLVSARATVSAIGPLEMANALVIVERCKRVGKEYTSRVLASLQQLPIGVEEETPRRAFASIMALARERSLATYDAAYLELAVRHGAPLATRDAGLRRAALAVGVPLA